MRTGVAKAVLALVAGIVLLSCGSDSAERATEAPLPTPVLLDGSRLQGVSRPMPDAPLADWEAVAFSTRANSPTAPTIGITRSGGRETQWSVNVESQSELDALWSGVVQIDGDWQVAPDGRLIEVWRSTPATLTRSWVFDFGTGLLTASPSRDTFWSFMANNVPASLPSSALREIEVLGQPGFAVEAGLSRGGDNSFIWWASDEFIYEIDTTDIDATLANLQEVDRDTWLLAVQAAESG